MGLINYLIDTMTVPFLSFSYETLFPNYGIAIILLTVLIRAAFYPLTKKQFQSMKVAQKLQPELKKIQEKFKGQPEKLQKEMMRLYRENNANPLGGCLPALIQLPFFFLIFYTVQSDAFNALLAQPNVNTGFLSFWITDLSAPDKTYVLPLLIGVTSYLSQKMMTIDPKQAAMFMFMPFIMFFVCLKMPAGVLLYWATSQGLSAAQQYYFLKQSA